MAVEHTHRERERERERERSINNEQSRPLSISVIPRREVEPAKGTQTSARLVLQSACTVN